MAMKRHADSGIDQGRRDASVSNARAVGEFVTEDAFDRHPRRDGGE